MLFISITVGLIVVLLFLYLKGKNKPSSQRSALEKIVCSLFSIFRTNLEETADAIRTPMVLKNEAMQEVEDALKKLEDTYKKGQLEMRSALKTLKEITLPNAKEQPGINNAKAKSYKNKYQESIDKGTPIIAYKETAIKALKAKELALANIAKIEKNIQKLEVAIEVSKAEYDGKKIELNIIKSDLVAMTEIPQMELTNSINKINSLKSELEAKMDRQAIEREVEEELRNESHSFDMEDQFNNL